MNYQIKLKVFEGPFDLLLHLIRENEVDIYDIPIAEITAQYLAYLKAMEELDLDITSGFLVMAATLLAIKAKMLLPPAVSLDEDGEVFDAREDLVRDILEYMQYKELADELKQRREEEKLHFFRPNEEELYLNLFSDENPLEGKTLTDLSVAFAKVLSKAAKVETVINIERERITVQDKLRVLQDLLKNNPQGVNFSQAFEGCICRVELIVTFLALLELARRAKLKVFQNSYFGEIRLFPAQGNADINEGN